MDKNKKGKLNLRDWCDTMRDLGYTGSMKKMFVLMDIDGGGSLSLDEIDPAGSSTVRNFTRDVKQKFGDMKTFFEVADENGDQCISRKEFVHFCSVHLEYTEKQEIYLGYASKKYVSRSLVYGKSCEKCVRSLG